MSFYVLHEGGFYLQADIVYGAPLVMRLILFIPMVIFCLFDLLGHLGQAK